MTKIVVDGHAVPMVEHLTREQCIARKDEVQGLLAELNHSGAWMTSAEAEKRREGLKRENEALAARLRQIKEWQKADNTRRNFAGLQSPLWDAVRQLLTPATAGELERRALEILTEREQKKFDTKK